MPFVASNGHGVLKTRYAIDAQSVRMVLWKQQQAYTICEYVIASVLCGAEPKTLFLITSSDQQSAVSQDWAQDAKAKG